MLDNIRSRKKYRDYARQKRQNDTGFVRHRQIKIQNNMVSLRDGFLSCLVAEESVN